jgi:hypothetical protein
LMHQLVCWVIKRTGNGRRLNLNLIYEVFMKIYLKD